MTQKQRSRFYYGWVILVICLIAVVVSYGMRFAYSVFLTPLEQEFHSSRVLVSAVFSAYMLLGSLFAIVAGWTADRYGPKYVFLIMGVFTCLALVSTSRATQLWQLFLTFSVLMAIGTGPAFVVGTSVAAKWFEKKRGLAIAIVSSGVGVGAIVMAPIAAWLMEVNGWRFSAAILGLIALVLLVPGAFFLKKDSGQSAALPAETPPDAAEPHTPPAGAEPADEFSLRGAIRSGNFPLLFIMWFFYSFCLFTIITHLVPHTLDLHIQPLQAASIVSVIGFTNIPGRILAGIVSDRLGRKPVALVSALLMLAALVLLLFTSDLGMFYVFAVIFGIGYGGLGTATVAMVGDIFGARHMGIIMGLLEVGWVMGAAVGPALAGYIYDSTLTYGPAFIIEVIAAFITLVLIFFVRMRRYTGSR